MLSLEEVAAVRTAKQQAEADQFGQSPRRNVYWEPRLGKTGADIKSLQQGCPDLQRGVVTAPYGVCSWWAGSLREAGYDVVPLYDIPLKEVVPALSATKPGDRCRPTIAITNYQRLGMTAAHRTRPRAGDTVEVSLGEVLRGWGPDALTVDESHMISSPSSSRGKQVRELAWQTPWVRCLSGTPAPNNWGDLWGSLSALDPKQWGYFFAPFAERWLLRDTMYNRVYGYRDPEDFRRLVASYSSFLRREDVFGPDQWLVDVRSVEMPKRAAAMYARLAKEWLIEDPDERLLVDGAHILTRLVRLQQIASGYVVGDDHEERPVHTAKLDAVEADWGEIIDSGCKTIVFHRFTWEGQQLAKRAERYAPCLVINGNVPAADRQAVVDRVRLDPNPLIVVVQTQSGGIGIDLSQATYAQIVSQSFSFVEEQQARDRIYMPGVPRHVMYYHTQGTVDEFIAEALNAKLSMHTDLLRFDRSDMAFGGKRVQRHKLSIDNVPLEWVA